MVTHIWRILSNKQYLWVKWIHEYRLKWKSFWDAPTVASASVGCRKLLSIRYLIRDIFISRIEDGNNTFTWHDIWSDNGPLANFISYRDIKLVGFCGQTMLYDICSDDSWLWYNEWHNKYPQLQHWVIDSHEHLFFNCSFSTQIWSYSASLSKLAIDGSTWKDVVSKLHPVAHRKSCDDIAAKLLFGVSVYFIWQERKRRLFNKSSMSCAKVKDLIYSTLLMKIMTIKWRHSRHVQIMKADWKVP
ncbi:uncharacterized protein [Rutidosis leptorrhynchoides]|uniref:uncharacterized protein n=1 Tax=Rutidosis leptorrhynchoides TaxID=125765 RepID=UPI003A998DDB